MHDKIKIDKVYICELSVSANTADSYIAEF